MLNLYVSLTFICNSIQQLLYLQLTIIIYYCRSYLTPVRDEESESQRKARSRQARQSRRSTQVYLMFVIYETLK